MKTILITGASSGLGRATAKLFAAKGWQVIATMRSPEKNTELGKIQNIHLLQLDVTDGEQTVHIAEKIMARFEVDVIFNNAGYGLIGPLEAATDQQLVRQFETNVIGVIRLIRAFTPYFRGKGKGLFITTTSIAGVIGLPLTAVYCATKWALEGLTESLSFELNELGIGIKTVAPGGIRTEFTGRSLDMTTHEAYREMTQKLYASFDPQQFTSPELIAEVVFEAATDDKKQLRYVAGADAIATAARQADIGRELFHRESEAYYFGPSNQ
jgi:NAD(P)-dependent dehydrogenase (short-subunit alcohol dehydrogenase family)